MAATRALLARIEAPDPPGARAVGSGLGGLLDDIRRNLHLLLNSVHGGSSTAPEFGVPDLTAVSRGEKPARNIAEAIQNSIARYEPRLMSVEVKYTEHSVADAFSLRFEIFGQVNDGGKVTPIAFRSAIEASGQISVDRT